MPWDARPDPAGRAAATALATGAAAAARPKGQLNAHVPALDGVRGCAVLLVIVYHFANSFYVLGFTNPIVSAARIGWLGVDVFFALSGFLITGILLDTKSSANYFGSFYARRFLRIFPLYYGAIILVLALWAVLPTAGIWGERSGMFAAASPLWTGLFLENATVAMNGPGQTGVLTHYWSLAVEEHFYLLWPAIVWLCSRRQLLAVALAAIGVSVLARAAVSLQDLDVRAVFGLTPLRMDGLAIGAVAAILVRSDLRAAAARWALPVLAGCAALLAVLVWARGTMEQVDPLMWVFAYPLTSLCTAAALIASISGGAVARLLSLSPLRWFGRYSYGLYVWHPIFGVLVFHSRVGIVPANPTPLDMILAACVALALDVGAAWLSFHLWEQRFLDLKKYFPARPSGEASPVPIAPAAAAASPAAGTSTAATPV